MTIQLNFNHESFKSNQPNYNDSYKKKKIIHHLHYLNHICHSHRQISSKVGDKLDHRDNGGQCVLATVIQKKANNLKIHYDNWASK